MFDPRKALALGGSLAFWGIVAAGVIGAVVTGAIYDRIFPEAKP